MQKNLTLHSTSGFMSAQVAALLLLGISLALAAFAVVYFVNGEVTTGVFLLLGFAALALGALYCAAFLIRTIVITQQAFMLKRPYARLWFKPMNTVQVNAPLNSIKEIRVIKNMDSEGDAIYTWKITQHNGSNVSFQYHAEADGLEEVQKFLLKKGIYFSR